MSASLGLVGLQVGSSIFGAFQNRSAARKAKRDRNTFWNEILLHRLNETMDLNPLTDEEMSSLRASEMEMPNLQMENQMRGLAGFSDVMQSKSGFSSSGFTNQEFDNQMNTMNRQYANQSFNVDRGIMDMQNQINDIIAQNKLRRTELEYTYKYG